MAYVILTACLFCQSAVTLNLSPLALTANTFVIMGFTVLAIVNITAVKQIVYLTMCRNNCTERGAVLHSLFHKFFRLHAAAVVGKTDYAVFK